MGNPHESFKTYFRVSCLGTIANVRGIILCLGVAVAYIVWWSLVSTHLMPIAILLFANFDNQKCLQTLPNGTWGAKTTFKNLWSNSKVCFSTRPSLSSLGRPNCSLPNNCLLSFVVVVCFYISLYILTNHTDHFLLPHADIGGPTIDIKYVNYQINDKTTITEHIFCLRNYIKYEATMLTRKTWSLVL